MIAAVILHEPTLAVDRATEFPRPDDERLVEQAAGREVFDERRLRLVDVAALLGDVAHKLVVLIPAAVIELHEPHAPLHEPPREQAVGRERAGLLALRPVTIERGRRLGRQIGELGHRGLHAEGHFVLRHAGGDLRIAVAGLLQRVQPGEAVEHRSPQLPRHARRVGEIEDGIAARAKLHALVARRQEARAPEPLEETLIGILAAPLREHDDEARQFVGLRAEAVAEPGTERRPPRLLRAGLEKRDRGVVVDRLGVHRPHETELVDDPAGVRQEFADQRARFTARLEAILRRDHGEALLAARHPREPLAIADRIGQLAAVPRDEPRLRIEQLDLRRAARLEEVDHPLGPRREVERGEHRPLGQRKRRGRRPAEGIAAEERGKRRGRGGRRARAEKRPTAKEHRRWVGHERLRHRCGHSFVSVSSRQSSVPATIVQAARSAGLP